MPRDIPMRPRCKVQTDNSGTCFIVEQDGRETEEIAVWWSRTTADKSVETLVIRQENEGGDRADLVMLTLGQAYDLIDALNRAILER